MSKNKDIEVSIENDKMLVLEGNFNYEKQIQDILEYFDFERVHETMTKLNLTWVSSDLKLEYIPEIEELKEHAKECLEKAIKYKWSESGGFIATNTSGVLNLYFVVESTMNDFTDLKDVKIYENSLNKEKILNKIKKKNG